MLIFIVGTIFLIVQAFMRVLFGDRVHFSLIITKIYPPNILLHLDDTLFDGGFGGFVE